MRIRSVIGATSTLSYVVDHRTHIIGLASTTRKKEGQSANPAAEVNVN
jgi:hypothetical protein